MRLFVNIIFVVLAFIPLVLLIFITINNNDFSYNKIFKPKIENIVPHKNITLDLWSSLTKCNLKKKYITLFNYSNFEEMKVPINSTIPNISKKSIQMKSGLFLKYFIRNYSSKNRKIELSIYKSNQKNKKLCTLIVKKKSNINNLITCFEPKLNDIFCIYISEQNPNDHHTKINIIHFNFDGKRLGVKSEDLLKAVNYKIKNIQTKVVSENTILLIIYKPKKEIEVFLLNNLYKNENFLYSCQKTKNKDINLKEKRKAFNIFEEGHKIYIEGHRGDTSNFHQNTILSFKDAIKNGLDSVELDVWLTKDNIPVVSHDLTLKYIKKENNTKDKLTINNVTYEYIKYLNENKKGNGKEIPTLEEVFDICKDKIFINIELKDYQFKKTLDIVTQLIKKKSMFNQISLSSLRPKYISLIKEYNQKNNIKIECGKIFKPFRQIKDIKKADGCSANVEVNKINRDLIKEAHKNGIPVMVYFLHEKEENETIYKKLIDYNVDVICCNYPNKAIKVRDKYYKQNLIYKKK